MARQEARGTRHRSSKNGHRSKRSKRRSTDVIVPKSPARHLVTLIWNVVFYCFILAIFLGALIFNFNKDPNKSFYGYQFMTVKTNSMAPNPEKKELKGGFYAGDLIIVKKVDVETLKKYDIITFFPIKGNSTAYLTHRLIDVETPTEDEVGEETIGFTTQGDANKGADLPILKKQVVGKVIGHMSGIGNVINYMRDNLVIVLVFICLIFGVTMTLKYYLSLPKVEQRRR